MSTKYPNLELGTIETVINMLGGLSGVQRFIQGEVVLSEPACRWRESEGTIHFDAFAKMGTGAQWIEHLTGRGFQLSESAKDVLNTTTFDLTLNTSTKFTILKGSMFSDDSRTTKNILAEAKRRRLLIPGADVACIFRDVFTDKDIRAMNLSWVIAMHEPIPDSQGGSCLLSARRDGNGRYLSTYYHGPDRKWEHGSGFIFADQPTICRL